MGTQRIECRHSFKVLILLFIFNEVSCTRMKGCYMACGGKNQIDLILIFLKSRYQVVTGSDLIPYI